jgi:hypothetical protein
MPLTKYRSGITILTENVANSLFGGLYGSEEADELGLSETDPLVAGHIHDGQHLDGHAQKINLAEHITGQLDGTNILDGSIDIEKLSEDFLSIGGAPLNAEYLVLSPHSTLTNERTLVVSAGELSFTDGGPDGDATLGLEASGVSAGSYTYANITVDVFGRVTAASNGTGEAEPAFITTSNITSNSPGTLATDDFVFGSDSLVDDGNTDHDRRFLFDKSQAAFRAGYVTGTQWDSMGIASAGFGLNITLSSDYTFGVGSSHTISGASDYSAVMGGLSNTITASPNSTIIGGSSNTISNTTTSGLICSTTSATINAGNFGADYSSIIGGSGSTIAANAISSYSGVFSGRNHDLDSIDSVILGGNANDISAGTRNAIIGGDTNSITATGNNNIVLGGNNNLINGALSNTVTLGQRAGVITNGAFTFAGPDFPNDTSSVIGQAQTSEHIFMAEVTTAPIINMTLDGNAISTDNILYLPQNSAAYITCSWVGFALNGSEAIIAGGTVTAIAYRRTAGTIIGNNAAMEVQDLTPTNDNTVLSYVESTTTDGAGSDQVISFAATGVDGGFIPQILVAVAAFEYLIVAHVKVVQVRNNGWIVP